MNSSAGASSEQRPVDSIHRLPIPQVYAALGTGLSGLNEAEAQERLQRFGLNAIREIKGKPLWRRFLANFTHVWPPGGGARGAGGSIHPYRRVAACTHDQRGRPGRRPGAHRAA
jgi:hypothetical protein